MFSHSFTLAVVEIFTADEPQWIRSLRKSMKEKEKEKAEKNVPDPSQRGS